MFWLTQVQTFSFFSLKAVVVNPTNASAKSAHPMHETDKDN
jgi:hypothetical protein